MASMNKPHSPACVCFNCDFPKTQAQAHKSGISVSVLTFDVEGLTDMLARAKAKAAAPATEGGGAAAAASAPAADGEDKFPSIAVKAKKARK